MAVLIVGAGPAGVATALLLARNGIDVTLVERETAFDRVFRGEGLMPSGIDAIFEMGLGEMLASLPFRKLESWDIYLDGREIFVVREPLEELGDRAVRVIPQPLFLARLVEEASKHPSFRFEPGTTVRGLLREGDRVTGARVQTAEGEREIQADLVIGCDGRASVVRKRANIELTLLSENFDVLWFKLPAPDRLRDRCSMMLCVTAKEAVACYTSWDGRLQFALTVPKGAYRDFRGADWPEELARPSPDWLAEHVRSVKDEIEGPILLDVIVGRCRSWTAPGVLLIGDAAHPMSPIRAQGINLALRDAIVTANRLVPVFRSGADLEALDEATGLVQAEREPEIVRAQTLQHRDTQGMFTRLAPIMIGLAKTLGPLFGRFEWAGRLWLRQQHDLRFGSTEVKLRV